MTNNGLDKSLNSLSSGLRINRAADDASGMAIANSLRQQANGLGQAISNANDGIGVTQTADGALEEYTKIIDTIRTKAVQAASDGQSTDTRKKIQSDIDRLLEEAQNIATTTSFNGQSLLNGAFKNKSFHIGAYAGESVKISVNDARTSNVAKFAFSEGTTAIATGAAGTVTATLAVKDDAGKTATSGTITFASGATSAANAQSIVDAFNASAQTNGADLRASVYEMSSSTPTTPAYSIRVDSAKAFTVNTSTTAGKCRCCS
jgi:flagellin